LETNKTRVSDCSTVSIYQFRKEKGKNQNPMPKPYTDLKTRHKPANALLAQLRVPDNFDAHTLAVLLHHLDDGS
jgi:hypothetical protein